MVRFVSKKGTLMCTYGQMDPLFLKVQPELFRPPLPGHQVQNCVRFLTSRPVSGRLSATTRTVCFWSRYPLTYLHRFTHRGQHLYTVHGFAHYHLETLTLHSRPGIHLMSFDRTLPSLAGHFSCCQRPSGWARSICQRVVCSVFVLLRVVSIADLRSPPSH